ncbi:type II secretion system minor pseudopilin GspI [Pararobbsia silviterrae]|uniref:Type II secretion system protein I n=1 Tax=Pararobbsia silviterrae TaxID=1792498 RepID=A0A494Y8P1_9BURK|nr:type II secretion system minor pseudopilin GspI [Pararobbsia silviterrae]RKP58515.1 type II secretion system protein GspI [Pararobbsia silviterrae]
MSFNKLRGRRPCSTARRSTKSAGFTMIEVLVALAIIAIALGASLRAVGSLAGNATRLHERMLAGWSADNVLATMTLDHQWPEIGTTVEPCPQGNLDLRCSITVRSTPNPLFRQIDVVVRRGENDESLANITTVVPNESRRSL